MKLQVLKPLQSHHFKWIICQKLKNVRITYNAQNHSIQSNSDESIQKAKEYTRFTTSKKKKEEEIFNVFNLYDVIYTPTNCTRYLPQEFHLSFDNYLCFFFFVVSLPRQ